MLNEWATKEKEKHKRKENCNQTIDEKEGYAQYVSKKVGRCLVTRTNALFVVIFFLTIFLLSI